MEESVQVKVRCSHTLHRISLVRGRLVFHDHHIDEKMEEAHKALTGNPTRCYDVLTLWRSEHLADYKRLPKNLAAVRRKLYNKRRERRLRDQHVDPLTKPVRERVVEHFKARVEAELARCDYKKSETRWAGGNHKITVIMDNEHIPDIRAYAFKVWSDNGKWSGTDSEIMVRIPLNWLKIQRRGLATIEVQNKRVFVLDIVQEDPLIVIAGRQGKGYTIYEWPAKITRNNTGKWLNKDDAAIILERFKSRYPEQTPTPHPTTFF